MQEIILSVILVVLILILILYFNRENINQEHFDTYYNHDFWDSKYYHLPVDQAALLAKYEWHEKDAKGLDIYDKYYENIVDNRIYKSDPEYVEREITAGGAYDTQFSTISDNNYDTFTVKDMLDYHPVLGEFNGNMFTLSQKNY